MKFFKIPASLLLVAGVAAPAGTAQAGGGIGVDLNYYNGNDVTLLAPKFGVVAPLGSAELALDWGLARLSSNGLSATEFLNPSVRVMYSLDLEIAELKIGGGAAAPLLNVGENTSLADVAAVVTFAGAEGFWDPWRYNYEALGLFAPVELNVDLKLIELKGEAALGLLLDVGDVREKTGHVFQLAGEAKLALLPVGLRLQMVSYSDGTDSQAQVSAEPFVSFEAGPAAIRAGLLINLDPPAGFSFDTGGVWGARGSVALSF